MDAGRPSLVAIKAEDRLCAEYKTGESELYDRYKDLYQLKNEYRDTPLKNLWRVEGWLDTLHQCVGEKCHTAEDGDY